MKQKLLKAMLLLCALVVGRASSVWGQTSTYQHVFNAKPSTGNNVTLSSVNWNISASNLGNYNSGNYAGVQLGTSSKNGSITLTSSSEWDYSDKTEITEVRLWLNLGGTSVTPTVTIGGVAATSDGTTVVKNSSAGSDWEKTTMVTFTPADNGKSGVVVINVATVKAGYICAMEIDCVVPAASPVETPAFNVAAGTYNEVKNVTITCGTAGASIYYTTDGTIPSSSSTPYSGPVSISESCTLKAIAIKGDDSSNVKSASYIIELPTDYNLTTTITSGKHYLIANGIVDGTVKVLDTQGSNNRGSKEATISSGVLRAVGACELIIQGPDKDGYYTIYDENEGGFLYAASGSSNYLRTKTDLDNNGIWSIAIDGSTGVATIIAQGENSHNWIRNNGTIFSCYSTGQSDVYLFEKDGEATPSESVTVTSAGYATYASNNALDFTGKSIEAYIATTKGDGTGVNFTRKYKIPARTGVLLHADGGATVDIPSVTGAADKVDGNKFVKGSGSAVSSYDEDNYYYILNNKGGNLGFYKANGQTVAANRAYISILKSESASVKEFIALPGFEEDDATSLSEELRMKNEESDNVIYNLAGQRLQKMQKGINIVNGKKVLF
jgi:hypothetical protein